LKEVEGLATYSGPADISALLWRDAPRVEMGLLLTPALTNTTGHCVDSERPDDPVLVNIADAGCVGIAEFGVGE